MEIFDAIISDRGSKYAVSGGAVCTRDDINRCLAMLKRRKKFAKATHHSWAAILMTGTVELPLKADDGEAGAGNIILRMLTRAELTGHLIIVTRWYGGRHLGGDRFRHVQDAVSHYLDHAMR